MPIRNWMGTLPVFFDRPLTRHAWDRTVRAHRKMCQSTVVVTGLLLLLLLLPAAAVEVELEAVFVVVVVTMGT